MEQSENQQIAKEISHQISVAERCFIYALTSLEGNSNYTEECVELWRIYRSLVLFHSRFQFNNGLGVWSFLSNTSV